MGEAIERLVALSGNPFAKKVAPGAPADAPSGDQPAGGFPLPDIKDKAGLQKAIDHHKALKGHIKKHAKKLNAQNMLPEDIKDGGADDATE